MFYSRGVCSGRVKQRQQKQKEKEQPLLLSRDTASAFTARPERSGLSLCLLTCSFMDTRASLTSD